MLRCRFGRKQGRHAIELINLLILAIFVFEFYLTLPPGIPYITSPSLVPVNIIVAYNAMRLLVIFYLRSALNYDLVDAIAAGGTWITTFIFVVFDNIYDPRLVL